MIICGDAIVELRKLPDVSVHCCVTSPPYWGLRDYGVAGQLGLEKTPEEYVVNLVAVFREVRRVLRDDGTLWLNLGDSYYNYRPGAGQALGKQTIAKTNQDHPSECARRGNVLDGLKEKDLVGVPWRVAFALQQPYYAGRIKNEADRIWMAAMIDGEGCMFIHKRKAGQGNGQGYTRKNDSYGAGLEVANCHESIIKRCLEITGLGSICYQDKESRFKNRNQRLYRWNLRSNECRGVIQEVYPYLVGKKHEARLVLGCPSSGMDAERAHAGLINLHNGFECDIDFPAPASMTAPGFYLRSDIIWSKKNPMPESVKDRPTRSHEYIFLMSKNARYYYDAEEIKDDAKTKPGATWEERKKAGARAGNWFVSPTCQRAVHGNGSAGSNLTPQDGKRNIRSVWTIATRPYAEAHFATFPPDLIEPCIKAGCPVGGTVLDPFFGAGTTGLVSARLGREFIGIELNPKYCEMAEKRIYGELGAK